jgi:ABC-type multidrug transport system fused ATPase/permease subunit
MSPSSGSPGIHNIFQQALGASQKVFEYLERDQGIKERPGAVKLAKFEHAILFDDRRPSVIPVRLTDSCWTRYAWEVNAGGSGRTGGAERRGQDYASQPGSALFTTYPRARCVSTVATVRDLRLDSLRSKIGIVAQDTFLF